MQLQRMQDDPTQLLQATTEQQQTTPYYSPSQLCADNTFEDVRTFEDIDTDFLLYDTLLTPFDLNGIPAFQWQQPF